MVLPTELVAAFAKTVKDDTNTKTEKTVYGTIVKDDLNAIFVVFDGSDLLTPVQTAVEVTDGERVIVSLKNHTATVTGNISSPAARSATVAGIGGDISGVSSEIKRLQGLETSKADQTELDYEITRIDELAVRVAEAERIVSAAEKQVTTNKNGVAANKKDIATNKMDIATNKTDITAIKNENKNILATIEALTARIVALESK